MHKTSEQLKYLEELRNRIKQSEIKKYGRLGFAYVRISVLLDYMIVIRNNLSELKAVANIETIKTGQDPAQQLIEYVILEVTNYYSLVYKYRKKENNFPNLPEYCQILRDFRCIVVAHLDHKERLQTTQSWLELYDNISKIGFNRIIIDLENYHENVVKIFGKDNV